MTSNGVATLADLREGEEAFLDRIDLSEPEARRLMELGFLPGTSIAAARSAPFGDPRVFRVDGSEVALRRETAAKLFVRTSRQNGDA
jgi:ferrous iron transport protein A